MAALLHVVFVGLPSFKQLLKDKAAAPIREALAQNGLHAPDTAASAAMEDFPPPADLAPFGAKQSAAAPDDVAEWPPASAPLPEQDFAPPLAQPASPGRPPLDQAVMLLIALCVVGAGTVVGLPYILQWLGMP